MTALKIGLRLVMTSATSAKVFVQSGSFSISKIGTFAVPSFKVIQALWIAIARCRLRAWDEIFPVIRGVLPAPVEKRMGRENKLSNDQVADRE